jgi:hypothetical protein
MLRKIAVVPTGRSKGEKVSEIREVMVNIGELEDRPGNGVRLIVVDAPDGDIAEVLVMQAAHPNARIIVTTDARNGNVARARISESGATKVSVVDCGNGGLLYEAKILLDILEAQESRAL